MNRKEEGGVRVERGSDLVHHALGLGLLAGAGHEEEDRPAADHPEARGPGPSERRGEGGIPPKHDRSHEMPCNVGPTTQHAHHTRHSTQHTARTPSGTLRRMISFPRLCDTQSPVAPIAGSQAYNPETGISSWNTGAGTNPPRSSPTKKVCPPPQSSPPAQGIS